MQLANPVAIFREDSKSFSHGSIELMRMSQIEAQSCLREAVKPAAQLIYTPPVRFPHVHVLNRKLTAESVPFLGLMNRIRVNNDGPPTGSALEKFDDTIFIVL